MKSQRRRFLLSGILASVLGLGSFNAFSQGFLEMPDTSEVPEFERESMLLDLDIPPVRDRDPDPEAGPRLNVKEFRLQGVVEFPDLGITRKELIKRVEDIRFDLMNEGELTDSGYTLDELGQISDLIVDIEQETEGEHVGPLEVQKLVFLIREQRRRRGVTLGMIETVADTITRYYRERGFILAKAYIPQQKVRDGVVTLTLLLGELGELKVENRKRVSANLIAKVFSKDMHKPVTSWNVEEGLYLINDIPGVTAQGFFQPGAQVGDTRLNINVLSERWFSSNIRLDNHGSETTGENRAYIDALIHNPLGIGDEIHISVLNSFNPENTTYGSFRYSSHLFSPRFRGSLGVSNNDFVSQDITLTSNQNNGSGVGNASATLSFAGESVVADASLSYVFKRSREKNISAEFKVTDISTTLNTFLGSGGTGLKRKSDVLNTTLGMNFDLLQSKKRRLHVGNVSLIHTDNAPIIQDGSGGQVSDDAKESAVFLSYDYSMLSFWTIPFTDAETRILFKSSGQFAGKPMTNVNQFSMTGPTRARGFKVNTSLFDDALYFGTDWIFKLPKTEMKIFGESLDRIFQPYVFADFGYGQLHPKIEGGEKINGKLGDLGVGLKFNHGAFGGSLSYASSFLDKLGDAEDETPDSGAYFELQYSF